VSVIAITSPAFAGRIVVNNDEWAFTDWGYEQAGIANTDTLVRNVATFLTGGAGKILIYSSDHGVNETQFLATLADAGYDVTRDQSGGTSFDLATLSSFDAIYLGGSSFYKDDGVLTSYVNAGGSVFVVAGTGVGRAVEEAARWNLFLNSFGLHLTAPYNLYTGTFGVSGTHAVFAGVGQLYYNNGNTVTLTELRNPNASIIEFSESGVGLFGVYDPVSTPEPQTMTVLAGGLVVLAWMRWRREHRLAQYRSRAVPRGDSPSER
jgi:hypothetical protein